MIKTIFKYESAFWLKKPAFYVYFATLLAVSAVSLIGSAGGFDGGMVQSGSATLLNAPLNLVQVAIRFSMVASILIPAIVGVAFYRDFSSNMHSLLFSYPFSRRDYLIGKLSTSFGVSLAVFSSILFGFLLAEHFPGLSPTAVGPSRLSTHFIILVTFFAPNVLFFSALVLLVVGRTRNIYSAFLAVIFAMVASQLIGGGLKGAGADTFAAIGDPFGETALDVFTRYWTVSEINQNQIPITGIVLVNRIVWICISIGLLTLGLKTFSFEQTLSPFGFRKIALLKLRSRSNPSTKPEFSPSNPTAKPARTPFISSTVRPHIKTDYSFYQHLKTTLFLSVFQTKAVVKSRSFVLFIVGSLVVTITLLASINDQQVGKLLPVTWSVLKFPAFFFSGIIIVMTFLYSGYFVNQSREFAFNELEDATPLPNWSFYASKGLALLQLQALMLLIIMIACIGAQVSQGFFDIDLPQYVFRLFILTYVGLAFWSAIAMAVQSFFSNQWVGFFLLIIGIIGIGQLSVVGISDPLLVLNSTPSGLQAMDYSDFTGYGSDLSEFFIYKGYWSLFAIWIGCLGLLFWRRGLPEHMSERFRHAKLRLVGPLGKGLVLSGLCFITMAGMIWMEENQWNEPRWEKQDFDTWSATYERRFKHFETMPSLQMESAEIKVDFYPDSETYTATGAYQLNNASSIPLDSVLVGVGFNEITHVQVERLSSNKGTPEREEATNTAFFSDHIFRDDYLKSRVLVFNPPLLENESVTLHFDLESLQNTALRTASRIEQNGIFLSRNAFPVLGYRPADLQGVNLRLRNGLDSLSTQIPHPNAFTSPLPGRFDPHDRVVWDITVGTNDRQTSIAPGTLVREWSDNERNYKQYVTDEKSKNEFALLSAEYDVFQEQFGGVSIEIYHHPNHKQNLKSIASGIKGAVSYGETNFGSYPHQTIRVAEFPLSEGSYATLFGNLMPMSEMNFIVDVQADIPNSINLPFYVAAHEIAHEWWGKQLRPADALGAKMMTEGLAEYTTLQVLGQHFGAETVHEFLKQDVDLYLDGRSEETDMERPILSASPNQEYITYRKASLAFMSTAHYLGESKMNQALRLFLDQYKYNDASFPTSMQLYSIIQQKTPAEFSAIVDDLFKRVTLHSHSIQSVTIEENEDSSYDVIVAFSASKTYENGSPTDSSTFLTYPLEIQAATKINEEPSFIQSIQVPVEAPQNTIRFKTSFLPTRVVLDPNLRFIDRTLKDNTFTIK